MMTFLAASALGLAGLPALLFCINLLRYRVPSALPEGSARPAVSVLIPARNEEAAIGAAIAAALASRGVELEVVVLDDHSDDRTAVLVRTAAERDRRVRLLTAPPLPHGWAGKQHACHRLAAAARHPVLVFLDADVRLRPDGLARLVGFLDASGADLVSGIPYQQTGTWLERLLIPLIHFVLLGYLPLGRMRASRHPAYAAGCGQLFVARAEAYRAVGGHGHPLVRSSFHDGLTLPRAFRQAGRATDLCDATAIADCRMYRNAAEVWRGLGKNATEGMASARLIVPFTVLLFGGQVLPFVLLAAWPWLSPLAGSLALAAAGLAYGPRALAVVRFRQSLVGAALHPLGVLLLLTIQWQARWRAWRGRPTTWKGRPQTLPAGKTLDAAGSRAT
jgi:hypothetical protein